MKKYLLLASTALLFAGNAMAGTIAGDEQSAIINVKANLHEACVITEVGDMDFGDIWLIPGDGTTTVAVDIDSSGEVSSSSTSVAQTSTGTAASVEVTCPTGAQANLTTGCADGYTDEDYGCNWTNDGKDYRIERGLGFRQMSAGTETVSFGGTLYFPDNVGGVEIDEPVLQVTLQYE